MMRSRPLLVPALLLASIGCSPAAAQPGAHNRCGRVSNPEPGNVWLRDRRGEWLLSSRGGYHARGIENLPDLTARGQGNANGSYDYACICITATVDPRNHRVEHLYSARLGTPTECRRGPIRARRR